MDSDEADLARTLKPVGAIHLDERLGLKDIARLKNEERQLNQKQGSRSSSEQKTDEREDLGSAGPGLKLIRWATNVRIFGYFLGDINHVSHRPIPPVPPSTPMRRNAMTHFANSLFGSLNKHRM